jgi:hypothetical protein
MTDGAEITEKSFDLVVVGGGIAGCVAATAAARLGLKVALVQNRPVLGGNASSEIGLLMGGADRDFKHARETGIIEEIDLINRYHNHEVQWRNSISDALLENMVEEAGVDLYLNTHVHAADMADVHTIGSVTAAQQATEKVFRFSAPLFVDATGDGSVGATAGALWMRGTEAREEFGESLAPETASDVTMGSTLMYRVRDVSRPTPFIPPEWAYSFPDPDDLPVTVSDLDRPQLWIEYGADMDTIGDHMEIREELLKILYGVWDHIKNHGDYGAQNYVLSWVGAVPGKRESRRLVGDYVLNEKDLTDPEDIPDAVAYGGWPIDVHNPKGFYAEKKWLDYTHLDRPYPIPYRCYYSKNIRNLFMTGRDISATHVAHGSIRLIRTCAVGGQAVGTAAYLCTKYDQKPRDVGRDHIEELQQKLLKYDCHIPGVTNEDPNDIARAARISASSEHEDPEGGYVYAGERVVSGLSRGRDGDENLWLSAPMHTDECPWLQLEWDRPVEVKSAHVTFDTMVREQRFFDRPVLGPIPTCVRDFNIQYRDEHDKWQTARRVSGNYLRHRILRLPSVQTSSVRITIEETNGDPHARIYEVRVYAE